jgi:DNA repair protein RecO (recombination protein O)
MNGTSQALLEPAYVLHYRPYRDSSLLLELLTPAHGRVALIARGARRPKSRLHGLLQPFQPLLASWSLRRELGTLTAVEARDGAGLRGRALMSGFYVNELLMRLLHRHDPQPQLFAAYETVLQALAGGVAPSPERSPPPEAAGQTALRLFELALLRELGYGLVLEHDVAGDPIRAEAVYHYYPERGPVYETAAAVREEIMEDYGNPAAVRVHGGSLLALAAGRLLDPRDLQEAKRLMRAVLHRRLGGRPLASRALFRRPSGAQPDGGPEDTADAMAETGDCT